MQDKMNLVYEYGDGICVITKGSTASGNITIPDTTYHNGHEYKVVQIDPKAFITITQINEVRGRGFTMEKLRYDELNQNKNGNMG